ncbi:unnamed protein product [Adineta ricciae]|uniref:Ig-like domain-containing protein n=1 Tax=Adineta ricciae TaxID=249248 RepID=A0A815JGM1_ADIRI|nr:unnamed protein product [Adineta ricciae]
MKPFLFVLLLFVSFDDIIARGPPTLLPETPTLIVIDGEENDSVELHCPVTPSSDLSVQWSKNNEELDPMWSTSNLLIRRFLLKIHRAQLADAGLYKCNVVNGFGNVHAQFRVDIKSNGTVTHGDLQQNIIPWDIDTMNGEAPEFLSPKEKSSSESTKVIQPENTTVQLKCLASGKPKPDVRWRKNGKILSEDEYGITQSQILNIKDLRQSDTGNYTCEVSNSFGSINATYVLVVTEKLQFFGNDPENTSVEVGQVGILHCRVQTNDPTTKIQWLKKFNGQHVFRPDAIIFGSEQYETIQQSPEHQYSNNILSKPLIFPQIDTKQAGEYICLIQNDKATNYKKVFLNILYAHRGLITSTNTNNVLFYVIIIPLFILATILFVIFCLRHTRHQKHLPTHSTDSFKSSIKPRQPLIQPNSIVISSRIDTDYLVDSVDSIPIARPYPQQQRYGPSTASDLASLASSNLYYARVQAL